MCLNYFKFYFGSGSATCEFITEVNNYSVSESDFSEPSLASANDYFFSSKIMPSTFFSNIEI